MVLEGMFPSLLSEVDQALEAALLVAYDVGSKGSRASFPVGDRDLLPTEARLYSDGLIGVRSQSADLTPGGGVLSSSGVDRLCVLLESTPPAEVSDRLASLSDLYSEMSRRSERFGPALRADMSRESIRLLDAAIGFHPTQLGLADAARSRIDLYSSADSLGAGPIRGQPVSQAIRSAVSLSLALGPGEGLDAMGQGEARAMRRGAERLEGAVDARALDWASKALGRLSEALLAVDPGSSSVLDLIRSRIDAELAEAVRGKAAYPRMAPRVGHPGRS